MRGNPSGEAMLGFPIWLVFDRLHITFIRFPSQIAAHHELSDLFAIMPFKTAQLQR
jgi:hypothetical protein